MPRLTPIQGAHLKSAPWTFLIQGSTGRALDVRLDGPLDFVILVSKYIHNIYLSLSKTTKELIRRYKELKYRFPPCFLFCPLFAYRWGCALRLGFSNEILHPFTDADEPDLSLPHLGGRRPRVKIGKIHMGPKRWGE